MSLSTMPQYKNLHVIG